jgi:hypothetical protein
MAPWSLGVPFCDTIHHLRAATPPEVLLDLLDERALNGHFSKRKFLADRK